MSRLPATEECIRRELMLLDPSVRADAQAIDRLLHPDFFEHGSSGRVYDRDAILRSLPAETTPLDVEVSAIRADFLAPDVVLVLFDTVDHGRVVHRSSIWVLSGDEWLIRFHQGTPVP